MSTLPPKATEPELLAPPHSAAFLSPVFLDVRFQQALDIRNVQRHQVHSRLMARVTMDRLYATYVGSPLISTDQQEAALTNAVAALRAKASIGTQDRSERSHSARQLDPLVKNYTSRLQRAGELAIRARHSVEDVLGGMKQKSRLGKRHTAELHRLRGQNI